jgi:hypothetical protein
VVTNEARKYSKAAEKGRELIEARPDQAYLYYNVACCEALAGEPAGAIRHLLRAIEMWEGRSEMAKQDSGDPIRGDPGFASLIG